MGLRGNYTPLDPRVIWGVGGGPEQEKTKVGELRYLTVAKTRIMRILLKLGVSVAP